MEVFHKVDDFIIDRLCQPFVNILLRVGLKKIQIVTVLTIIGLASIAVSYAILRQSFLSLVFVVGFALWQYSSTKHLCRDENNGRFAPLNRISMFYSRIFSLIISLLIVLFGLPTILSSTLSEIRFATALNSFGWIACFVLGMYIAACRNSPPPFRKTVEAIKNLNLS